MLRQAQHEDLRACLILSLSKDEATVTWVRNSYRMTAFVYMLRCCDGRYYVGSTRGELEKRVQEHNAGTYGGFTKSRPPVALVYSESFDRITDAIATERRLKGWSRAKKEALIAGDFDRLSALSRNKRAAPHPSTGSG